MRVGLCPLIIKHKLAVMVPFDKHRQHRKQRLIRLVCCCLIVRLIQRNINRQPACVFADSACILKRLPKGKRHKGRIGRLPCGLGVPIGIVS